MADAANVQVLLREVPIGKLQANHFQMSKAPMPTPSDGEVLVRVLFLSLDAASRTWMQGRTYRDPLKAGDLMAGGGICEVLESRSPAFNPGDLVMGETGWQQYSARPASTFQKLAPVEPITYLASVYGYAGLTAYHGLLDIGQAAPGETVVISAAGGAVGLIAGQIAKIRGCRVIGIAGGAQKCKRLVDEYGFDAAIDYKSGPLYPELKSHAPKGIDVYFDNVAGDTLEACLARMAEFGRIICCGALSAYDGDAPMQGPRGVPGLLVTKRITMKGFIVFDFAEQRERALSEIKGWVASGALRMAEDIVDGIDNAPQALVGLLAGENFGKRLVRVAEVEAV